MVQKFNFVVEPSSLSQFYVEGTQYIPKHQCADGWTLILLHANGMHKETFEVMLHYLLSDNSDIKIKDVWSIGKWTFNSIATLLKTP